MSKSLGNFVTIHELLAEGWPGEVLRLNMLRTHYRQPIDWTKKGLEESQKTLAAWFSFEGLNTEDRSALSEAALDALEDDLNTPKAIAELHGLAAAKDVKGLGAALGFLGFGGATLRRADERAAETAQSVAKTVEPLIAARLEARKRKDFKESDRIRDELAKMGIALKDTKNKETGEIETTWEIAR
jgi:cysteinyl-tRNA synthetase